MDRAHDNLRRFCTSATELAEFVKLNLVICKIVKKKKIKITTVPTHNPPHSLYKTILMKEIYKGI